VKSLPLASLTLIACISLTGCTSSLSLEDQTKLIEYEKCLDFAISLKVKELESRGLGRGYVAQFMENWIEEGQQFALSECESLRP